MDALERYCRAEDIAAAAADIAAAAAAASYEVSMLPSSASDVKRRTAPRCLAARPPLPQPFPSLLGLRLGRRSLR